MKGRILEKDRYIFLKRPAMEIYHKSEIESRERQISLMKREFIQHKLSLMKLSQEVPDERIRNLLLNIALIVSTEETLVSDFLSSRRLPFKKISRIVEEPVFFLQKHEQYLTAYVLLFCSGKYPLVTRYLQFAERGQGDSFQKDQRIFTGIALKKHKDKTMIMTSQGEFLAITGSDSGIGEITTGRITNTRNHLRIPLVILTVLLAFFLLISYNMSKTIATTVRISASGLVQLQFNELGTMLASRAENSRGTTMLEGAVFDRKDIDTAVGEIIEQAYIREYIKEGDEITILISGEALPSDFFTSGRTHDRILSYQLKYKINNLGNLMSIELKPTK